ncbi:single-stranded DNA-binding protein [Mucilaginibacter celer]|uniref:Single-stranded DNA-binding protein n=1 Tax=Mucilaginibacter celer TaxID=2305508 RepID=A0A494VNC7_9SPHI|nr:single-stranded DNA-binding protein [Mucilaginibacter celer]AYL95231.1 single-stranded DNA-binding protein [Mucilaginibacter celer]
MSGINKVVLIGNVGEDPALRFIGDDIAVASFRLLTAEQVIKNGVKTGHNECHNIVMLRSVAEHAFKVLKKGKLICVEGKLQTRFLDDPPGMKKITEVVAFYFRLLGRSSDFEEAPDRIEI